MTRLPAVAFLARVWRRGLRLHAPRLYSERLRRLELLLGAPRQQAVRASVLTEAKAQALQLRERAERALSFEDL